MARTGIRSPAAARALIGAASTTAAGTMSAADKTLVNLIKSGSAAPEGAVTAPVGTIYLRTGGSAGSTFYVKESGSGNTGWSALAAPSP